MTKGQKNELTAGTDAMALLAANSVAVGVVPDIVTNQGIITTTIANINTQATIQQQNNKGKTTNKGTKKSVLITLGLNVIDKVVGSVYCETEDDLKALVYRTKSQLNSMRPQDLINFLTSVAENVAPHLTILESAGLTAADLTALITAYEGFNVVQSDPRAAIAARKAATLTMSPNFKIVKTRIKSTSKLFINLISNEVLYNNWFAIVKVFKTGIRHTLREKELAAHQTIFWTKVYANSNIINSSVTGDIRAGGGKKVSDVTEWIIIPAGTNFLNFFGPNVIIQSLSTGIVKYTLHSKSIKGKIL